MVRIESWTRWPWLRHGFSTRRGGVSTVYGNLSDLNLGWTREDDPALVAENRRRFVRSVGGDDRPSGWRLVTVRQVHSNAVHAVGEEAFTGSLETTEGKAVLEGDGLMTQVPGVMIAVGTADCVPVLLVDTRLRAVAALHAGWRGTVAGIAERGVEAMRSEYGSRLEDLAAAIGPAIGACCYAVGDEVRAGFAARYSYADALFRNAGAALYVDLWEANRRQLLDAGLGAEQIEVVGECTACARDHDGLRYFSHRGERGVAGRMLSAVAVLDGAAAD
ncbi:peptidoglycan editing factor PgeF [Edaphobacter sp.]|uniref:peptidoglycan editing factor PgeF n=1 Tax=Edaphobacter sp. TaxID=1934404 RepID=UPI002DB97DCC|nr:peptidoglycan editing factor PgeF [Edaphobacter sp.]HEU5342216.1 peptidoglycan editing factor PgeF [Edaphobacter sp.]